MAHALVPGHADGRPDDGKDGPHDGPENGVGAGLGAVAATAAVGAALALVHLNEASSELVMTLKKIGRKRAKRIVAHRPFGWVTGLERVLPERVYKVVKHQLTV